VLSCRGVRVYYVLTDALAWQDYAHLTARIDPKAQQKIAAFKSEQDKLNCLLGRILLSQAINDLKLGSNIADLHHSPLGKASLPGMEFSISHSSGLVVLSAALDRPNGIDCEELKPVEPGDFRDYFSRKEWDDLEASSDPLTGFNRIWTRKEALLKAIGTGLQNQLNRIDVSASRMKNHNCNWSFKELELRPGYLVSLCYKD